MSDMKIEESETEELRSGQLDETVSEKKFLEHEKKKLQKLVMFGDEHAAEKSSLTDDKSPKDQNESTSSLDSSGDVIESAASEALLKVESGFNPSSETLEKSRETEDEDAVEKSSLINNKNSEDQNESTSDRLAESVASEDSLKVEGGFNTSSETVPSTTRTEESDAVTDEGKTPMDTVMDEMLNSAIYREVGISEGKSSTESSSHVEFASEEIHEASDASGKQSAVDTNSENKRIEERDTEKATELPSKQKNIETDDMGEKLHFLPITQASLGLNLEEKKIESEQLEKALETVSGEQNLDTVEKTDGKESLEKALTEEETSDANLNSLSVSTGTMETKLQKDETKSKKNEGDTEIKTYINLASESVTWATEETSLSKKSEQLEKSYGSASIVKIHDAFDPREVSAGIPEEEESLVHSIQIVSVPEASGEESLQKDGFVHDQLVENSGASQNFEEETDKKEDPDSESTDQILGNIEAIQENNEVVQNTKEETLEIDRIDDGKLGTATVTMVIEETILQKAQPEGEELKNASELEPTEKIAETIETNEANSQGENIEDVHTEETSDIVSEVLKENPMEEMPDSLPIIPALIEESLKKDEIKDWMAEKVTKSIQEDQSGEADEIPKEEATHHATTATKTQAEEIYLDDEKLEEEIEEQDLGIIDATEKIETEIPVEEQIRDNSLDTLVAMEAEETCFQKEETESEKINVDFETVSEKPGYDKITGSDTICRESTLEDESQNRNFDALSAKQDPMEECSEKDGFMGGTDSEKLKIEDSEAKEIRSGQIDETVSEVKSPEHEKKQLENLVMLRDEDAAQKSNSANDKYPNNQNEIRSGLESSRDVTESAPLEALLKVEGGFNPFFETVEKSHETEDEDAVEQTSLIDNKKSEDQNKSVSDESTSGGSAESSRAVTKSVASEDFLKVEGEFNPSSMTVQSSIGTEDSDAATDEGKILMDTGMDETVNSAIYGEVGISEDKNFTESSSQVEFASEEINEGLDASVTNSDGSVKQATVDTCSEKKGTEDRDPEKATELPSKQKNVETDDVGEKLPFLPITQASLGLNLQEKIESGESQKPLETVSSEPNLDTIEAGKEKEVKEDEPEKKTVSSLSDKTQTSTENEENEVTVASEEIENEKVVESAISAFEDQNFEPLNAVHSTEEILKKDERTSSSLDKESVRETSPQKAEIFGKEFEKSTDLEFEEKTLENTDDKGSLEKALTEEETSDATLDNSSVSTGVVEIKLQKDEKKSEKNEDDTETKTDINLASEPVMWTTEETSLNKESEQLEKSYGSESNTMIHHPVDPSEVSDGIHKEEETLVHRIEIVSVTQASVEESLQKEGFAHNKLVENSGASQNFEKETDQKEGPDSESGQILGTIEAIQETSEAVQNIKEEILEIDRSGDEKLGAATVTMVTEETSIQKAEPEGEELKNTSEFEPAEKITETTETNETNSQGEKIEDGHTEETSDIVSEVLMESPMEEKSDSFPIIQALVEESLQKDKIKDSIAEKVIKPIQEDQSGEADDVREYAAKEIPEKEATNHAIPAIETLKEEICQDNKKSGEKLEEQDLGTIDASEKIETELPMEECIEKDGFVGRLDSEKLVRDIDTVSEGNIIKTFTEAETTTGESFMGNKSEEKVQVSSAVAPEEKVLETIDAGEMIKEDIPVEEEIHDKNIETPLVEKTTEETEKTISEIHKGNEKKEKSLDPLFLKDEDSSQKEDDEKQEKGLGSVLEEHVFEGKGTAENFDSSSVSWALPEEITSRDVETGEYIGEHLEQASVDQDLKALGSSGTTENEVLKEEIVFQKEEIEIKDVDNTSEMVIEENLCQNRADEPYEEEAQICDPLPVTHVHVEESVLKDSAEIQTENEKLEKPSDMKHEDMTVGTVLRDEYIKNERSKDEESHGEKIDSLSMESSVENTQAPEVEVEEHTYEIIKENDCVESLTAERKETDDITPETSYQNEETEGKKVEEDNEVHTEQKLSEIIKAREISEKETSNSEGPREPKLQQLDQSKGKNPEETFDMVSEEIKKAIGAYDFTNNVTPNKESQRTVDPSEKIEATDIFYEEIPNKEIDDLPVTHASVDDASLKTKENIIEKEEDPGKNLEEIIPEDRMGEEKLEETSTELEELHEGYNATKSGIFNEEVLGMVDSSGRTETMEIKDEENPNREIDGLPVTHALIDGAKEEAINDFDEGFLPEGKGDEKLEETTLEFECEDWSYELNDAYDAAKYGISNEKSLKMVNPIEKIKTMEGTSEENQNSIIDDSPIAHEAVELNHHKTNNPNETTKNWSPNEEVKEMDTVSIERNFETRDSIVKIETVTLKDGEDPDKILDASHATNASPKEIIQEKIAEKLEKVSDTSPAAKKEGAPAVEAKEQIYEAIEVSGSREGTKLEDREITDVATSVLSLQTSDPEGGLGKAYELNSEEKTQNIDERESREEDMPKKEETMDISLQGDQTEHRQVEKSFDMVSEGHETAGSEEDFEKQVIKEETVEESFQEVEKECKKLEEAAPKLETEDQSQETNQTNGSTKNQTLNEEVKESDLVSEDRNFKTIDSAKKIETMIIEDEEDPKTILDALPVSESPAQETTMEVGKKTEETSDLVHEEQIQETINAVHESIQDNRVGEEKLNETSTELEELNEEYNATKSGIFNEEVHGIIDSSKPTETVKVKESDLVSEYPNFKITASADKIKTMIIEDEEEQKKNLDSFPVTESSGQETKLEVGKKSEETSDFVHEQIQETMDAVDNKQFDFPKGETEAESKIPNEKVKDSESESTEWNFEIKHSTEKIETVTLKDEEDPNKNINVLTAKNALAKEIVQEIAGEKMEKASDFIPEEQIEQPFDMECGEHKTAAVDEDFRKEMIEEEIAVKGLDAVSVQEETVEERFQEDKKECKKIEESELKAEVQSLETNNTNGTANNQILHEEVKELDLEMISSTAKIKTMTMKEEDQRNEDVHEEQIQKITNADDSTKNRSPDEEVKDSNLPSPVWNFEPGGLTGNEVVGSNNEEGPNEKFEASPAKNESAKENKQEGVCEKLEEASDFVPKEQVHEIVNTIDELKFEIPKRDAKTEKLEKNYELDSEEKLNDNDGRENREEEKLRKEEPSDIGLQKEIKEHKKPEEPLQVVSEGPETAGAGENIGKKIREEEGTVKNLDTVSTVRDNMVENTSQEDETNDAKDTRKKPVLIDEVKDSDLVSTERNLTKIAEKIETTILKDVELNKILDASPATKVSAEEATQEEVGEKLEEAFVFVCEHQIQEPVNANLKNIEFTTEETTVSKGLVEVEKLKYTSSDSALVHETTKSSDTAEGASLKGEKLSKESGLVSEEQIHIKINANEIAEDKESPDFDPINQAMEGANLPTKEGERLHLKDELSDKEILKKEGEELEKATDSVSEKKIQEINDANVSEEIRNLKCEEIVDFIVLEHESMKKGTPDDELEAPKKLKNPSDIVLGQQSPDKTESSEDAETTIAQFEENPLKNLDKMSIMEAFDEDAEIGEVSDLVSEAKNDEDDPSKILHAAPDTKSSAKETTLDGEQKHNEPSDFVHEEQFQEPSNADDIIQFDIHEGITESKKLEKNYELASEEILDNNGIREKREKETTRKEEPSDIGLQKDIKEHEQPEELLELVSEGPETAGAGEDIGKEIIEEEGTVKNIDTVSIVRDEMVENSFQEDETNDANDIRKNEVLTDEVKDSDLVSKERNLTIIGSTEKIETTILKDDEELKKILDASPVTKLSVEKVTQEEVGEKIEEDFVFVSEYQIQEPVNANLKNKEYTTEETSVSKGLVAVEKLKNTSSDSALVHETTKSRDTGEGASLKGELIKDSGLVSEEHIHIKIDANEITEDKENLDLEPINQAMEDASLPTEEGERQHLKDGVSDEEILQKEGEELGRATDLVSADGEYKLNEISGDGESPEKTVIDLPTSQTSVHENTEKAEAPPSEDQLYKELDTSESAESLILEESKTALGATSGSSLQTNNTVGDTLEKASELDSHEMNETDYTTKNQGPDEKVKDSNLVSTEWNFEPRGLTDKEVVSLNDEEDPSEKFDASPATNESAKENKQEEACKNLEEAYDFVPKEQVREIEIVAESVFEYQCHDTITAMEIKKNEISEDDKSPDKMVGSSSTSQVSVQETTQMGAPAVKAKQQIYEAAEARETADRTSEEAKIIDEDTSKSSLQKGNTEGEKLEKPYKLESEEKLDDNDGGQSREKEPSDIGLQKDIKVHEQPEELLKLVAEGCETVVAGDDIGKPIIEEEATVTNPDTVSIVQDEMGENSFWEDKTDYANDTRKNGVLTDEAKDSDLVSTVRNLTTTGSTEKIETTILKDDEELKKILDASPSTKVSTEEASQEEVGEKLEEDFVFVSKYQIQESVNANLKNTEFTTEEKSVPKGLIEVEKLKKTSDSALVCETTNSSDTAEDASLKGEEILQKEGEELEKATDLVSEEKIQETNEANVSEEVCNLECEEFVILEQESVKKGNPEDELEAPEKLENPSDIVLEQKSHEKTDSREDAEIPIAAVEENPLNNRNKTSIAEAFDKDAKIGEDSDLVSEAKNDEEEDPRKILHALPVTKSSAEEATLDRGQEHDEASDFVHEEQLQEHLNADDNIQIDIPEGITKSEKLEGTSKSVSESQRHQKNTNPGTTKVEISGDDENPKEIVISLSRSQASVQEIAQKEEKSPPSEAKEHVYEEIDASGDLDGEKLKMAAELEPHETKESDVTTKDGIPDEEVEDSTLASTEQNFETRCSTENEAVSVNSKGDLKVETPRKGETSDIGLQKDRKEQERIEEPLDMVRERPETEAAGEDIGREIIGEEEVVKNLDNVSIQEEMVEKRFQEDETNDANDITNNGFQNIEIDPILEYVEQNLTTTGSTEKIETMISKDDEDPNKFIDTSLVTKVTAEEEASSLLSKERIHIKIKSNEIMVDKASSDLEPINQTVEAVSLPTEEREEKHLKDVVSGDEILEKEGEKLGKAPGLVSDDKIEGTDANVSEEICNLENREMVDFVTLEQASTENRTPEEEIEAPEMPECPSDMVLEQKSYEKTDPREDEKIPIAEVEENSHEHVDDITETSDEDAKIGEVSDLLSEAKIHKTVVTNESTEEEFAETSIPESKLGVGEFLSGPDLVPDEKIHESLNKNIDDLSVTQVSGKELFEKEGGYKLAEATEISQNNEEIEKAFVALSEEQTSTMSYSIENEQTKSAIDNKEERTPPSEVKERVYEEIDASGDIQTMTLEEAKTTGGVTIGSSLQTNDTIGEKLETASGLDSHETTESDVTMKNGISDEEVEDSNLVSAEQNYETRCSTEKEAVSLNNEEDPHENFDASRSTTASAKEIKWEEVSEKFDAASKFVPISTPKADAKSEKVERVSESESEDQSRDITAKKETTKSEISRDNQSPDKMVGSSSTLKDQIIEAEIDSNLASVEQYRTTGGSTEKIEIMISKDDEDPNKFLDSSLVTKVTAEEEASRLMFEEQIHIKIDSNEIMGDKLSLDLEPINQTMETVSLSSQETEEEQLKDEVSGDKILQKEREELGKATDLVSDDKIRGTDGKVSEEICNLEHKEKVDFATLELASTENRTPEDEIEAPKNSEHSDMVLGQQSYEKKDSREDEKIPIAKVEENADKNLDDITVASDEDAKIREASDLPSEAKIHKTVVINESAEAASAETSIPESKLGVGEFVSGPDLVPDEKIHESEQIEDLSVNQALGEGPHDPNENASQKAVIELKSQKPGEAPELESEAKCEEEENRDEITEKKMENAAKDLIEESKSSYSDLLERSTKEGSQMTKNFVEESKQRASKDESQNKQATAVEAEEEKTYHEVGEHKTEELDYDAPVIVDAATDADVKPAAHKKSHNILSGVGSKVKHSIAKVKEAITCSHPRQLSLE